MTPPSPPENQNYDEVDEPEQIRAEEVYRPRLGHYYYLKTTEECDKLHYATLAGPIALLASRIFFHASNPWDGETLALNVALIEAMESCERRAKSSRLALRTHARR